MQTFSETIRQMLSDRREKLIHLKVSMPSLADTNELRTRIEAAFERLNNDTFGVCSTCGQELDEAELLANPLQISCISHLPSEEQKKIYRDQGFAESVNIASFEDDVEGAGITLSPWNRTSPQDLDLDIDRARSVQGELLPEADVCHDAWEISYDYVPAGALSGDHCDIVRLSPGGLLIVLGDAMGKGITASMISSRLHVLFRALVDSNLSVAEILERANRIFCQCVSSANQYATILCLRAAPDGTLELANAGHLPPFAVRENGIEDFLEAGYPLGMFFDSTYKPTRVHLEGGETLLCYTDGVTEARDEAGTEYGRDRLAEVADRSKCASPREIIRLCREDVSRFTRERHFSDDFTLLALRRVAVLADA
jgi:sigma-B regulation protein RsbU (phosphoserine phosphatase)